MKRLVSTMTEFEIRNDVARIQTLPAPTHRKVRMILAIRRVLGRRAKQLESELASAADPNGRATLRRLLDRTQNLREDLREVARDGEPR
ncbi:hypothetical protein EON81_28925 [bacterium]|nr:MAG: hypothetical protein EON81_28925 [bacterium]